MKINLIKNTDLDPNEVKITVEFRNMNNDIENLVKHIELFNKKLIVNDGYNFKEICYEDIISFFSQSKNNYCKDKNGIYRIKSKLYEIEQNNKNFIRISKNYIVNVNHIRCFDMGEKGKIIIRLDDNTEEIVARRRVKDVLRFLKERSL